MKTARKSLNLSQMQLAERCGISTSFIGEIEICRKFPSPAILEAIAGALGMRAHQLLDDGEGVSPGQPASVASFAKDLLIILSQDIDKLTKEYLARQLGQGAQMAAEAPNTPAPIKRNSDPVTLDRPGRLDERR